MSLVFQTTQCSVSHRALMELCLSWSSMESHSYTVFGAHVPHQHSSFLEAEGKKAGTAGSPCTLSNPHVCLAPTFVHTTLQHSLPCCRYVEWVNLLELGLRLGRSRRPCPSRWSYYRDRRYSGRHMLVNHLDKLCLHFPHKYAQIPG